MPGSSLIFDTNAYIAWCFEDSDLARQAVLYAEPALTIISMGELEGRFRRTTFGSPRLRSNTACRS